MVTFLSVIVAVFRAYLSCSGPKRGGEEPVAFITPANNVAVVADGAHRTGIVIRVELNVRSGGEE